MQSAAAASLPLVIRRITLLCRVACGVMVVVALPTVYYAGHRMLTSDRPLLMVLLAVPLFIICMSVFMSFSMLARTPKPRKQDDVTGWRKPPMVMQFFVDAAGKAHKTDDPESKREGYVDYRTAYLFWLVLAYVIGQVLLFAVCTYYS